jgi:hypothetical protein
MRELEKHASRIAREIEGEDTKDTHLAEERGLYLDDDLDHDEEIKYSAVCRDTDNSKFKTFSTVPSTMNHVDTLTKTGNTDCKDSLAHSSTMDEESSYLFVDADPSPNIHTNNFGQLSSDYQTNKQLSTDKNRLEKKLDKDGNDDKNMSSQPESALSEGRRPQISEDLDGLPSSSRPYEPPSFRQGLKSSDGLKPDLTVSGKHSSAVEPVNSQRPGSSTSSTSERIAANSVASAPGLSPSSSMGSLTSEKSTLNPNAKEFRLNPNAKSFTPSVPVRPSHPPASDGSYYYPNNIPTSPLGPGLPVGMGYGQQMMIGHSRPVYYYAPQDMQQYRGRNF